MATPLEMPVEAARPAGDFNQWMLSEQRRVFLLCYRMLRDRDEANTATQDAFLKAYKALNQPSAKELDDPAKWLTRVTVNTCLDRLRSRSWKFWRKRPEPEAEETILSMASSGDPTAEDRVFAREIEERMAEALSKLSPNQRAVFTLRHYEDRRLEEIAELLDMKVGTVKAHMARALAKLRNLLEDLYIVSESHTRVRGDRP